MRRLFIAIPSYTGKVSKETRKSLRMGLPTLGESGKDYDFMALSGMCYLDNARNILVAHFMRSQATDLMFIDDDVGFDRDALVRIRDTTPPVVAGIYPKKCTPTQWPVSLTPEMKVDREGLVTCDVLPTGFMRINRSVFEALEHNVYSYINAEHGDLLGYFKTAIHSGKYWGEDVLFGHLWKSIGGELRAFVDMTLTHTDKDGKVYGDNWGRWMIDEMVKSKRAA